MGRDLSFNGGDGSTAAGGGGGGEDPLMERFVEALRQRGFFAGLAEGSPAWAERLAKAQEKFRERQARGGAATAQGASTKYDDRSFNQSVRYGNV